MPFWRARAEVGLVYPRRGAGEELWLSGVRLMNSALSAGDMAARKGDYEHEQDQEQEKSFPLERPQSALRCAYASRRCL